jgi:hypothetical protein
MNQQTLPAREAIRLNKWSLSVDNERVRNCRGTQIRSFLRHRPIMPHRAALVIALLSYGSSWPAFMTLRRALARQWDS